MKPNILKRTLNTLFWLGFSAWGVSAQEAWEADFYNMLYPAQAIACGLSINDSIDERRHPLMMARAIQHWRLTGCAEPANFSEKNDLLTHQIEKWDDRWQPIRRFGAFDMKSISEVSGISVESWKEKNPQFTYSIVPADTCWIFVPKEIISTSDSLLQSARMIYRNSRSNTKPNAEDFYTITVRSGESLSLIARREGVSVDEIQAWNKLRGWTIYPGQELIIGVKSATEKEKPVDKSAVQEPAEKPASKARDGVIYIVKSGDSLWSIARQFPGVSAQNIIEHNALENERIDVGQRLIIPKYE